MPVYNIVICDDNIIFSQSLEAQCGEVMSKLNIPFSVRRVYSYEEMLRDYAKGGRADLLLVSIVLGHKSGLDLVRKLKERGCTSSVVLMAADQSYLLEGYSVQPVYFLMKPVDPSELERAIKLDLKRQAEMKSIVLKCGNRFIPVPIESIQYIEAVDHELLVHTRTKDYSVRMTFSQIMDELPPLQFSRCHNSYVVNLARVSSFSRGDGVALDCRVKLPLGRKHFDNFRRCFIEYMDAC